MLIYKIQEEYEDNLGYNKKDIVINSRDKKITIYGFRVQGLKDLTLLYATKHDKNFKERVKNKIKEISKTEEIDIEKYCFDTDTKDKFLEEE